MDDERNLPAILDEYEMELERMNSSYQSLSDELQRVRMRNHELEVGKHYPVIEELIGAGRIFDPPIRGEDIASFDLGRIVRGDESRVHLSIRTHQPASPSTGSSQNRQPRTTSGRPRAFMKDR